MRRGQRLIREIDRQQHADAGCIHQPSLEPLPRRWPRINHGTGPRMPGRRDGCRCQRNKPQRGGGSHPTMQRMPMQTPVRIANHPKRHDGM
jgi:hypothetical protein